MFGIGIIFMYIVWGGFVAIILYALYRVLSVLLNRYLAYKQDETTAIREQNEALREIAAALRKQNNSTPPELP